MTLLVLQHRSNLQGRFAELECNHQLVSFRRLLLESLEPVYQSNYDLHTIEDIDATERLLADYKLFAVLETQELSLLYQELARATYVPSVVECHMKQPILCGGLPADKSTGIALPALLGP